MPDERQCWCGCGSRPAPRKVWAPGHDRKAEAAVIRREYGSIAEFVRQHGYGPGGKNPITGEEWQ